MLLRIFTQSRNRHFVKIKIFRYKFKSNIYMADPYCAENAQMTSLYRQNQLYNCYAP